MLDSGLTSRKIIAYYRDLPVGPRKSEIDCERRGIKSYVAAVKCPGCGWTPQWKSAIGPHPLHSGDTIYCSINCFEREANK